MRRTRLATRLQVRSGNGGGGTSEHIETLVRCSANNRLTESADKVEWRCAENLSNLLDDAFARLKPHPRLSGLYCSYKSSLRKTEDNYKLPRF